MTRYAQAFDGVSIAYQVVGDGPRDLVWVPGWVSHLEAAWEEPTLARFFDRLASFSRLVRDTFELVQAAIDEHQAAPRQTGISCEPIEAFVTMNGQRVGPRTSSSDEAQLIAGWLNGGGYGDLTD